MNHPSSMVWLSFIVYANHMVMPISLKTCSMGQFAALLHFPTAIFRAWKKSQSGFSFDVMWDNLSSTKKSYKLAQR